MTHYMELLSLDQPYNLILYMVIPMGLAELLVAMEFFTMYHMDSGKNAGFKAVSKFVGIVLGVYFTALVICFLAKIYPTIKWRGYADVIAIYSYLIGVIPLLGIALLELNLIYKKAKLKLHFCLLIFFLIVGHVAMIFGMVDPTITGYKAENGAMDMQMNMPMNMPADMPMHDHHKMMMDMQQMSDDNSTNMHMHH